MGGGVPFPTHTEAFMKVVEMMTSGEGAVVKDKKRDQRHWPPRGAGRGVLHEV